MCPTSSSRRSSVRPWARSGPSGPLNFFVYVLFPLVWLTEGCQDLLGKALKIKPRPEISERDLMAVITDSYDEGAIEKEEHDLIQNSLNFDDKTIERVMTPMGRAVCAADDTMSVSQIRQLFIDNNYSRMPYIDRASGQVEGIIFQRDFYESSPAPTTSRRRSSPPSSSRLRPTPP